MNNTTPARANVIVLKQILNLIPRATINRLALETGVEAKSMRPLPPPLGHRGVFQTGQAEPQAWQFPWTQRQRGEMAGLHGTVSLCAAAIHGAPINVGTQLHAALCRRPLGIVGADETTDNHTEHAPKITRIMRADILKPAPHLCLLARTDWRSRCSPSASSRRFSKHRPSHGRFPVRG